jgi:multicomponent Na+:H+ antiporter subunit E
MVLSYLVIWALSFLIYIVFSGSVSGYDIVTGAATSVLVSVLSTPLVKRYGGLRNVRGFIKLIQFGLRYAFIDEVRAHADLVRRIYHPSLPMKPAFVKIPIKEVKTGFGITLIANSITNTPGTVTVDVGGNWLLVHWIDAEELEPEKVRERVSRVFESYAKEVFG